MYYATLMSTLTLRLDPKMRKKLKAKAKALRISESELVRQALDRELERGPLGPRISKLAGILSIDPAEELTGWRAQIRAHNWRE